MKKDIMPTYIVCPKCNAKYNKDLSDICPLCNEQRKFESKYYGLCGVRVKNLNLIQKLAYNIFKKYGIMKVLTDREMESQLRDLSEWWEAREMFCNADGKLKKKYL